MGKRALFASEHMERRHSNVEKSASIRSKLLGVLAESLEHTLNVVCLLLECECSHAAASFPAALAARLAAREARWRWLCITHIEEVWCG